MTFRLTAILLAGSAVYADLEVVCSQLLPERFCALIQVKGQTLGGVNACDDLCYMKDSQQTRCATRNGCTSVYPC